MDPLVMTMDQRVADASDCSIVGIRMFDRFDRCQPIHFTAVGAGMDNREPSMGDVRWVPHHFEVGHIRKNFMFDFCECFIVPVIGEYMVDVSFLREVFDGLSWMPENEYSVLSVPILVN